MVRTSSNVPGPRPRFGYCWVCHVVHQYQPRVLYEQAMALVYQKRYRRQILMVSTKSNEPLGTFIFAFSALESEAPCSCVDRFLSFAFTARLYTALAMRYTCTYLKQQSNRLTRRIPLWQSHLFSATYPHLACQCLRRHHRRDWIDLHSPMSGIQIFHLA